jgi:hypothetical protein
MNIYRKFFSGVWVAECDEQHKKGDIIPLITKRGIEHDCVVYNEIQRENGKYYYSIVRADGFTIQERARKRAEKYEEWSKSATAHSIERCNAATDAVKDIPFGQPILVDHYSSASHRRALNKSDDNMRKSIELMDKAESHNSKAEYWKRQEGKIDLSMPESLEYFRSKLDEARRTHAGLKDGTIPREHSYSLTYARKRVNDVENKVRIAKLLWGNV